MLVLLYYVLLPVLFIIHGSCLTGNVCTNRTTQEDYCCFGSEQIGDNCQVCQIGYNTEENGIPCQPCGPRNYGKKCTSICKCSITERCNHVNGSCTSEEQITTLSPYVSTDTTSDEIKIKSTTCTSRTTFIKKLEITDKVSDETVTKSVKNNLLEQTGPFTTTNLIIYCLSAACFILVMVLCYKHKLKAMKKKLRVITNPEAVVLNVPNEKPNAEESEMESDLYMYHVIDESQMVVSCDKPNKPNKPNKANVYLDVVSSSVSESSDIEDKTKDANEYLHPYHSLVENTNSHDYEGDSNFHDKTEDGYLHPYNALLEKRKSIKHDYEKGVIQTNGSNSSSSTSSLPNSDKEGYMHMYQQLEKQMKRKSHKYEISAEINITAGRSNSFNIVMNGNTTQTQNIVRKNNESVSQDELKLPTTMSSMSKLLDQENYRNIIEEDCKTKGQTL
ncbi:uncharacterized protein [Mytilus edulis]|uniref:uncharacterized protein n=1 Tax=Mytilus edulis TaxID=6550 RepID=UPI0039F11362